MWSDFRCGHAARVTFSTAETESSPWLVFRALHETPYALLLLGQHTPSYLLSEPNLIFVAKGQQTKLILPQQEWSWEGQDPLLLLNELLEQIESSTPVHSAAPETTALFGYFGYESARYVEPHLSFRQPDPYGLPDILLLRFKNIHKFTPLNEPFTANFPKRFCVQTITLEDLPLFHHRQLRHCPLMENPMPASAEDMLRPLSDDGLQSHISRQEYVARVQQVRAWIAQGDIYQANFTYRLSRCFTGSPYELFLRYYQRNPSEYFAYWNTPGAQILSASPERFLQTFGQKILATPIKGTSARAPDANRDRQSRERLWRSEKDNAELNMITDLLRNDLHRVCLPGSVQVEAAKNILSLSNVHHLYSTITGRLVPGTSAVDIVKACFPSGSITGCPKLRSIELLSQLELHQRAVYTGSIGFVARDQLHLNVAIRTAIAQRRSLHFHVGGGVVWDSDPGLEWAETKAKARTFAGLVETLPDALTDAKHFAGDRDAGKEALRNQHK